MGFKSRPQHPRALRCPPEFSGRREPQPRHHSTSSAHIPPPRRHPPARRSSAAGPGGVTAAGRRAAAASHLIASSGRTTHLVGRRGAGQRGLILMAAAGGSGRPHRHLTLPAVPPRSDHGGVMMRRPRARSGGARTHAPGHALKRQMLLSPSAASSASATQRRAAACSCGVKTRTYYPAVRLPLPDSQQGLGGVVGIAAASFMTPAGV